MDDPRRCVRVDERLGDALFLGELPKQLLIDSAAGTGKTWSILSVLHCLANDVRDLRILIVRQTRASLTESVMVTYEQEVLRNDSMEWIARGAQRMNRRSYRYPKGSTVVMGGLDNPDRILSTAWDIIFVNECIEISEESWDSLWGRLNRPGRSPAFGFLIGDTNPGDPSHWLKKRADAGEVARWQVDHRANPCLFADGEWTPAGLQYLDSLRKLKGTRRKRFLEGIWAAGEGQWFDAFDDGHVSNLAAYDPALPVHLAVDSGVHTGAVWFQVHRSGRSERVTVFGDFYAFDKTAYEVGKAIFDKGVALCGGRCDWGSTDPAGRAMNAVGPTVLGEYRRAGLALLPWPKPSIADGLALINSFVAVKSEPPDLLVHPDCTRLLEAFANYRRAKRGGQWIDRPEDPQHPYEDVMDALRGGLNNAFPKGRGQVGMPAMSVKFAPPPAQIGY